MSKRVKFIFVVGGVISGLGKGITAASIGRLLQDGGWKVSNIKIDAYVNVDAGTMNPTEHGEVFVTEDGLETDQDIGNYERFLGQTLSRVNYATTGQIYKSVIERERNLGYGGKCVEVVPHIPLETISRIKQVAEKDRAEIVIIEIGGTVGEYQNILFLEAGRMMKLENPQDVMFILLSYLPTPKNLGEMKTKPTQNAARALNAAGIQADFILGRAEKTLDEPRKEKISILCNVGREDIIAAPDVANIYQIPLNFKKEKFDQKILKKFGLKPKPQVSNDWEKLINSTRKLKKTLKIGMVGKYFSSGKFTFSDSYHSVIEAVKHAAWANQANPEMEWINSGLYEKHPEQIEELAKYDAIIVPGGFGSRGVQGILSAIRFARERQIPYLGICYGMQLAVVEFACNVCGLKDAHTTEINHQTSHPVISLLDEQICRIEQKSYGGTMRLGAYPCRVKDNTVAHIAYSGKISGDLTIQERHRHRYELNNQYLAVMEKAGLVISGVSPDGKLVEIIELPKEQHPFFVGAQFHPEFKSQPLAPHPLFRELLKTACQRQKSSR